MRGVVEEPRTQYLRCTHIDTSGTPTLLAHRHFWHIDTSGTSTLLVHRRFWLKLFSEDQATHLTKPGFLAAYRALASDRTRPAASRAASNKRRFA